jgi:type I restriction enzyme, S subunit
MTATLPALDHLRPNPDWASLPLFDRTGWKRVRFGDVVENLNETVRTPAVIDRFIGMEHLEPGSLHIREWGDVADGTTFTRRCRPGQVLFGKRRAYQRKVAVAEFDALVSGDIYVLAPKDTKCLLPELLPFLCLSERFFQHAVGTSAGSLSPRTNWSSLASFEFDLPPLDQQRRIAEILWAVDESNEANLAQLPVLQSYQRDLWEAHKAEKDVKTVRIGDVAVVANGSTPSKAEDRYWIGGTFPWLPTGKVHDRFIRMGSEFITEAALKERKARVFPRGSVLVAMIGQGKTRGSAALMEIEASVNQNFACIVPRDIESYYLFCALDFSYEALRRSSHGSNQEALNCGLVSDYPVPCAPRKRQVEIADAMKECEQAKNVIETHCTSSARVLKELINVVFPV